MNLKGMFPSHVDEFVLNGISRQVILHMTTGVQIGVPMLTLVFTFLPRHVFLIGDFSASCLVFTDYVMLKKGSMAHNSGRLFQP
jgi:hypothetical protein